MEYDVQNNNIILYGTPTVETIFKITEQLREQYSNYKLTISSISPEDRKMLTALPLVQEVKRRVEAGDITLSKGKEVVGQIYQLPIEEIQLLVNTITTGTLEL